MELIFDDPSSQWESGALSRYPPKVHNRGQVQDKIDVYGERGAEFWCKTIQTTVSN
jgi:hypothetical protein